MLFARPVAILEPNPVPARQEKPVNAPGRNGALDDGLQKVLEPYAYATMTRSPL